MRFADQYIERMSGDLAALARQVDDVSLEVDILDWRFASATSAVQIAAGPNPVTNVIDMVVMVSLSRRIIEADWLGLYGAPANPVLVSYRSLEEDAWILIRNIATEQQLDELRALMDGWYADNPGLKTAAFTRFADFSDVGVQTQTRVSPGLLGIVGLDPMSGIDPAVREVEQSRQLAERAVFYAQRLPQLLDLQASLFAARFSNTPQVNEMLGAISQVGEMSASLDRLVQETPDMLSREREAAIVQFMGELQRQQQDMLVLATQLRATLEAGTVTATSLDAMIQSTDRLMARFEPDPDASQRDELARPFDINEYTHAIIELAATAREFQALASSADGLAPKLAGQVDQLTNSAMGLVDYAFTRLLLLVLAVLVAGLAYRLVANRMNRPGGTARSA
jgi:hypothetical protein